VKTCSWNCTL